MANKFASNNKLESVTKKFIDEFLCAHPQNGLPVWFKQKTTHQTIDKDDNWQLSIVASKKPQNPSDSNVIVDKESGETRYVIADSYEEIVLFSMKFKKSDMSGEIIVNQDFSRIDGDQLVSLS